PSQRWVSPLPGFYQRTAALCDHALRQRPSGTPLNRLAGSSFVRTIFPALSSLITEDSDKIRTAIRGPLGFSFDNGRCMFCPGSGTNTSTAEEGGATSCSAPPSSFVPYPFCAIFN